MFLVKGKSVFSKLFLFFLVLSFIFLGLVWPGVSHAESSATWEFLANILATPVYWLATLVGELLNLVIYFFVIVAQYNDIITADPVQKGWVIVRDLCNMFFVVVLLVIAFGTVLKVETYHYKRLLPKFLLMAILINFSKTIAGLFIDAAQIIMLTFVAGFVSITGGNLIDALKVSKYLTFKPDTGAFQGAATIFVSAVLALIAIIIALIVVVIMAVILVFRIVALWILVILSPLAYLLSIVPAGQKYSSQWWQQFTKYLIVGPIMAFFLWLSLTTASTVSKQIVSTTGKVIPGEAPTGQIATGLGSWDVLGSYIIGICLLVGSLVAAQQIGVAGGKMAGDWAGKIQRTGVNIPKAGALFAGRRLDMASMTARMEAGKWLQKKGEGKDTALGFLARGAGKVVGSQISMRPTVWKKALQEREARWERKHYAEPLGTAQNILNRVTFSGDRKINYARIRQELAEREEEKLILASSPGYNTEYTVKQILDNWDKNPLGSKTYMREAMKIADVNEVALNHKILDRLEQDLRKMPDLFKKFGVTSPEQLGHNPATIRALTYILSQKDEEKAAELANEISNLEFKNGNFHLSGMSTVDMETGKWKFTSDQEQAGISSGLASLLSVDALSKTIKSVFTDQGVERDKAGRRIGEYRYTDEKTGEKNIGQVFRNEKGQWESAAEPGKIIADIQVKAKRTLDRDLNKFATEFIKTVPFESLRSKVTNFKPQALQAIADREGAIIETAEKLTKEGEMAPQQLESLKGFIHEVKLKRFGAARPSEIKFPKGVEAATATPIIADFETLKGKVTGSGSKDEVADALETQLKKFEENIVNKVEGETKGVLQEMIKRIRTNIGTVEEADWEDFKGDLSRDMDELIKEFTQSGGQGKETKKGKGLTGENLEFWKKRPGKET